MDLFPNDPLFVHDICQKIGKDFVSSDFVKAVRGVGKLAWQTLLSGNPMFRKEKVIRAAGPDVFEWGLLIGDEDPEGLSDETADILITFAHRSIQEFFGAFYFILSLSERKSMVSLLGGDCEKPIFLTNPLFLEFCLWLMHTPDLTSFPWAVEERTPSNLHCRKNRQPGFKFRMPIQRLSCIRFKSHRYKPDDP